MIDKAGMLAFFLVFLWTGAYTGDVREAEEGAAGHAAAVETALSTEDVRAPNWEVFHSERQMGRNCTFLPHQKGNTGVFSGRVLR